MVIFEGMKIVYMKYRGEGNTYETMTNITVTSADDKFIEVEYRPRIGAERGRKYYKGIPLRRIVIFNREELEI